MDESKIKTHTLVDRGICGVPEILEEKKCVVRLVTSANMRADESGLVHGGFLFGLADYAAMLAVNHPNVVLAAAEVSFLKPVAAGETLTALAEITSLPGKKHLVEVKVSRDEEIVFKGQFTCIVPERHVLGGA